MDYVRLGRTGIKVSRICLGCMTYGSKSWRTWVLDEDESRPFIKRALELGINFFDTANVYSLGQSEEILGRAVRDMARREELVIATKVRSDMRKDPNGKGLSRKAIMTEIDNSLRRLAMDYVDLYQIHRWDYETPIEETMEALHDVVKAGKARYIGASSMYTWQFVKANAVAREHGWTEFVSMQPQYNLIYREEEREMLPYCRDAGIGVIPWSPLARGFLAGNRHSQGGGNTTRAQTDDFAKKLYYQADDFAVADRLAEVAKARGVPPMQMALAWVLSKPVITAPIIGASKPNHLDDAVAALSVKLSAEEAKKLEEPYKPHAVQDHQ
ncbi:MAG TPA: aldo/keto reductase [Dongiaceae bacterium]|jgi:aryl-alcohol dehydrogenase (NADP+)|nr:aldo/keto reductase [Dongiaceae bacterium]